MELISVIVPAYNAEPYLDRCIRSVTNQTYTNLELILVDDGSTDKSLSICHFWAEKDDRIIVVHKQNGGVSSARNAGLEAATGDSVFFCDADDEMVNSCLEYLLQSQREYDSDIVVGQVSRIHTGDELSDLSDRADQTPSVSISVSDLFDMQYEKRIITGKLIRRDCINDIRFDTNFTIGEDTVFLYSVVLNRHLKLSFCPQVLYLVYRDHVSSTTGNRVLIGFYNVGKWCVENWKRAEPEEKDCILLAGFKNLFLYRRRYRKDSGYPRKKEASQLLVRTVPDLLREQSISVKQRIAYSTMTFVPAVYSVYASRKN